MLYYRYRPPTEVCFKELLYNEMFFCSPEECNDPFDSKAYLQIPNDVEKIKNLLKFSWKQFAQFNLPQLIDKVTVDIANKCPLSYENISSIVCESLQSSLCQNQLEHRLAVDILLRTIQSTLHLYKPPVNYFVSFSRINDEPLMWSHYADKHQGFCLIFKAIDGMLQQDHKRIKKNIHRKTPSGIAPSMSCAIPEKFRFSDIDYPKQTTSINALYCFPEVVSGRVESEEERLNLCRQINQFYLQKHHSWECERESRLILSSPISWLFGDHYAYSPQDRLLYFEPTQLVGIIFGSRIKKQVEQRIFDIIKTRQEWLAASDLNEKIVFDFVVFKSAISSSERAISIEPYKIYGLSQTLDVTNAKFEKRYFEWQEGRGLAFHKGGASKVCISSTK